jgi:hypothetical protein
MKSILTATAALAAVAMLAPAPAAGQAGERINRVIVYGNDSCPRGEGDDVVICGRRGENERYRIPEELRDGAADDDPESESWAVRATTLEYVGRTGIQSCSTVGPGGFTGCWAELMRAAREDRAAAAEPGQ